MSCIHTKQKVTIVWIDNNNHHKHSLQKDQKMEAVAKKLCVPLLLLAAISRDSYRKPCTGMWEHLVQHENRAVKVEEVSFFVGDAAGREASWMPGGRNNVIYHLSLPFDRQAPKAVVSKFIVSQACCISYSRNLNVLITHVQIGRCGFFHAWPAVLLVVSWGFSH